jgi:hypothetical protein
MPLVKKSLADRQPPAVADGLAQATDRLHSANAQDRWEAARQLAEFAGAATVLSRHLTEEQDERVREAVLTSLAKINNDESFDAILPYLRVDDAAIRTAALDALKLMPDVAGARLDVLLHDPDADVRVLACDLARAVPPAIAQKSLAAILASEAEINVCAAAIDLLAEIGTPEILPELALCAERFSAPFLNFSVQIATNQINARSARPQE